MTKVLMMMPVEGGKWEEQNVRIGKIRVKQIKSAFKKFHEIIALLENDESAGELMDFFWALEANKKAEGEEGEEETALIDEDLQNKMFMENVIGAFKILFDKLPEQAFELVSIISGIDEEVLDEQEYNVLFDILEAIIEANDVQTIVQRLKDLFFTTRNKWGGLKAIKG